MANGRRIGRWVLYSVGGLLVLLIAFRVGLGIYLGTSAGKAMVARKVSDQIGLPVEVTSVRVGLATSSIGMRVFDPAAPTPDKSEILAVENADADISLFWLGLGRIDPAQVELRGVNLTLHVSADGEVVTTLPKLPEGAGGPGKVPVVKLTNGRITIHQAGRPEFTLQNLNLTVEQQGENVKLAGTIDDPQWSKWTVSGEMNPDGHTGWVELASDDAPLTMARLESIPFVPPVVWEHIRADGRGAAKLRLSKEPAGEVRYAVDIRPRGAELTITDASTTLRNLTGLINVSGAKVTLDKARAELAGGTVAVDGTLDFGPDPNVMTLKVAVENLDIRRLPAEWRLPKKFEEGKLTGNADLTLHIHSDGRIDPAGSGKGTITGMKVLGFPADDITINLGTSGGRYEFRQPKKVARRMRPADVFIRAAAPRQEPKKDAKQDEKKEPPKKKVDPKEPPKKDEETTLDATIRLRDIDIAQLLERLEVKLDYKIGGKVTVEAAVAVPLGGVTSEAAYQFTGKLSSPALSLEGLTIRDLTANMVYQDGLFTLKELKGTIDQPGKEGEPGVFRGTLTAKRAPPGDVTAELTIDRIPVGEVLKALPGFALAAGGTVSGKVNGKAPFEKFSDPAAWSGTAELTSAALSFEGRNIKDVRFAAALEKGVVTLKDASINIEGIPVTADGSLTLADKYPFTATVRTTGTSITDLRKLVPEVEIGAPVEGVLETETKVTGTASPLSFNATGTITATKLTLGDSSANRVALKWSVTEEKLTVSDLKADVFGGTVTGSADVPFAPDKSGKFAVNFKELDAAKATKLVPDAPVRITGKVSGSVKGEIPAAQDGQGRIGRLDLDLSAPKLTVQGFPAERLTGKIAVRNGVFEFVLEGKTLDGSFDLKGRYPGQKKQKKDAPGLGLVEGDRGLFRLRGANLARIAPAVGYSSLAPLSGRLDVTFEFDNDLSAGSGTVTLTRLGWGGTVISEELTTKLRLSDGLLEVADVSGRVAGGELRARGRIRLNDMNRNFFTVSLTGADAQTLLGFVPDAGTVLEGPVSVIVHVRMGGEVSGSGTVTMSRGTAAGIQVTDLRVPFEFVTSPRGHGRFTIREASLTAGSGRARGELTMNWGTTMRVDGQVRFNDLPLRAISAELGEYSLIGNGRITGRFDLAGSNVRTVNDLTGTLIATLNNTSVREVPILRQAAPFLNPIGAVKPFEAGDVRANLRNGVFHIQRLALANPTAQLFAEGTIALSGRLDLDVVAHTGTIGPQVRGLRLFGLRLPAFGPIPLTLIRDVSDFLSNRTVRLTITGSTSNPLVRVNVGALLTEQAVRFFLSRYVLPAEAASALGLSAGVGIGSSTGNNK